MKKMLMLAVVALSVSLGWAQTKTTFSYRYESGKTYRYASQMDMKMTMDMNGQVMNMETGARTVLTLQPVETNADGDITFTASYDSIVARFKGMGRDTTMTLTALIGKRAKLVISKFGKTKSVTAIDSLEKNQVIMQMMNGDPLLYMRRAIADLPMTPLAVGEKWNNTMPDTVKTGDMEMVTNPNIEYVLAGNETVRGQECKRLNLSGPTTMNGKGSRMGAEFFIEGEGKSSGSMWYNEKSGILVATEALAEQQLNIAVSGGAMTMTQSQTIQSKTTLRP
jgi:hypothetical protein